MSQVRLTQVQKPVFTISLFIQGTKVDAAQFQLNYPSNLKCLDIRIDPTFLSNGKGMFATNPDDPGMARIAYASAYPLDCSEETKFCDFILTPLDVNIGIEAKYSNVWNEKNVSAGITFTDQSLFIAVTESFSIESLKASVGK